MARQTPPLAASSRAIPGRELGTSFISRSSRTSLSSSRRSLARRRRYGSASGTSNAVRARASHGAAYTATRSTTFPVPDDTGLAHRDGENRWLPRDARDQLSRARSARRYSCGPPHQGGREVCARSDCAQNCAHEYRQRASNSANGSHDKNWRKKIPPGNSRLPEGISIASRAYAVPEANALSS
jgi:hypothetical protein